MADIEDHILPSWWPVDLSPSRVETWQENGKWFAKLVYQGERDGIKYRLRIPKVYLGRFTLRDIWTEENLLSHCSLGFADFDLGTLDVYRDDHGNVCYWKMTREIHEMTIEQIEKELGYKVKIVED